MASPNIGSAETGTAEFILHVIPPPMRLNWSTPRSLLLSTFLNHARKDKAPIGHLFVEFTLPQGKRVITGMSRQKMSVLESLKVVQGNHLGLGTFYYDFKGKLDSATEARDEIEWAKKNNRYATIRVVMDEQKSNSLMLFLKNWIERGSFRHYSGGLRVDIGEGAGCAEFGMQCLGLALGVRATHPDWMRRVRVPHHLIGGGFAPNDNPYQPRKVHLWNMIKQGYRWAYASEENRVYSIPDPELIFDWIKKQNSKELLPVELKPNEISWQSGECSFTPFEVKYEVEPEGSIQEQWSKIITA